MMRVNTRSAARAHAHIYVDFDGTIATVDTTDLLLSRFAAPQWQVVEEEWKAGRIGSRECMVRQIDLVRASPDEMMAMCEEVEVDPGFATFVEASQALGLPLTVVSDGLDFNVNTVLRRHGVELPVRANHLRYLGDHRWSLTFPYARSDCATLAGNCKCQFPAEDGSEVAILVGDGRSDLCVAGRVDFVLAKASLLQHCRKSAINHVAFETFDEARDLLALWISTRGLPEAREQARSGE